jgi:2'-5' RNA ligase
MPDDQRLFIGIAIPANITSAIFGFKPLVEAINLRPKGLTHLTLKFLGATPEEKLASLKRALASLAIESFNLEIKGLGCFLGQPKTIIYALAEPCAPLTSLYEQIDQTLAVSLGIKREKRKFHPHVTLARVNIQAAKAEALVKSFKDKPFGSFIADCFGLYQSTLQPSGPLHTLVETYRLS